MPALGQRKNLYGTGRLLGDGLHLRHGSVLIVEALNREDGAGDVRKIFFNIPGAKVRMQPDIVPSPKREGGVAVMASQFLGEIRCFKGGFGYRDACDAEVLDKDVRS